MVVGTRIDLRLGVVSVGRIRRLLLRVDCKRKPRKIRGNYNNIYMERGGRGKLTGHQVLQIQLLLLLTLVAQADRSAGQQNGSQQTSTDACPGHNVRPIIDDLSVVAQYLNMEEHTLDTRTTRGRERERMREGESNSPCSIAGSNPRQRLSPSQRTRPYAKDPLRQRPADR